MIAPARLAAYQCLRSVASGTLDLGTALARERHRLSDERDRALAGEIAAGTLRWQGAFDHLIAAFSRRPIARLDPEVLVILRMTIFQLLHLQRVPAAAAVKDAVDLAGKAGKRSAAGLVNAVLRRVSRERDELPLPSQPADESDRAGTVAYVATTLSQPVWLASRWLDRIGFESTVRWAKFNNSPAPLTLRVNSLRTGRSELIAALAARGVETEPARHAPDGLIVRSGNPLATPLADEGFFVVQDEASQLVGLYAGAREGEMVLDACAAPGGKTTAMASAMQGTGLIVACDVRGRRVELLNRTVGRSGAVNVRVVQADTASALPFRTAFNRVLLDAPCSGLGTIRRDPDIKWRRKPEDLRTFADTQIGMLQEAASVLVPGGVLVYATCSSEPEENDAVVDRLVTQDERLRLLRPQNPHPAIQAFLDADGRFRTLPHRDGLEAFFAAMLVRD